MSAVSPESALMSTPSETLAGVLRGHPMFPRAEHEAGPERRRIDLIQIERLKDDGTWETCPRVFKATDLRSWKEVVDLYGGGVYRARAQCARTYQWQGTTERKQFCASPRPFVEGTKPRASAPATLPTTQAPFATPHGWAPPSAASTGNGSAGPYGYPAGWAFPMSANVNEPPAWLPLLLRVIERRQQEQEQAARVAAPALDPAFVGMIFQAMAERDAVLFRLLVERPGAPPPPPPAAPAVSTLEVLRELKPLLEGRTGTGQFMQGIETAKSLVEPRVPASTAPEEFATAFAAILRNVGAPEMPEVTAPSPGPAPPPPAAASLPAPVLQMDDLIRMVARDRTLARRVEEELGRNAVTASAAGPAPLAAASVEPDLAPPVPRASAVAVCAAYSRATSSLAPALAASAPAVATPTSAAVRPASTPGADSNASATMSDAPQPAATQKANRLVEGHRLILTSDHETEPRFLGGRDVFDLPRLAGPFRPETEDLLLALTGRTVGIA